VDVGGRLHLFVELCTDEPEHCSISYRDEHAEKWIHVADDACSCASWTALALGSNPAVVVSERRNNGRERLELLTLSGEGLRKAPLDFGASGQAGRRWQIALSLVLALVLTYEMRRHRVQQHVFEGSRRALASLWRRALAQLVDAILLASSFMLPVAWMWRLFSDPDQMREQTSEAGPTFMLWF
jgi:hypothetical protein